MKYNLLETSSKRLTIMIYGSGDANANFDKFWQPVAKAITSTINTDFLTFEFSSILDSNVLLKNEIIEFESLLEKFRNNYNQIEIFATSQGSVSGVFAVCNKKFSKSIRKLHLIDPADYLLTKLDEPVSKASTWSGADIYSPKNESTISFCLRNVLPRVKVNVVHFILKNYSPAGYIEKDYSKRGINQSGGVSRLNSDMVKHFYQVLPYENKGLYIEHPMIPHGIGRDGDLTENQKNIIELFCNLLN